MRNEIVEKRIALASHSFNKRPLRNTLLVLTQITMLSMLSCADAFTSSFSNKRSILKSVADDFGGDELAKLRQKRKEIMEGRKKRSKPLIPDIPEEETVISDSNEIPAEEALGKLPPRPKEFRGRPSSSKDEVESKDQKKSKKSTVQRSIDYLADYPDENDLHIPNRLGFGTSHWGDEKKGFVGDPNRRLKKKEIRAGKFNPGDLQVAYNTLVSSGISFIDTSESYGSKFRSERLSAEDILGRFSEEVITDSPPILASKYSKIITPPIIGTKLILNHIQKSCQRMETSCLELYQIQNSALLLPFLGQSAVADGLAAALDRGYCNHVGVCNMGASQLNRFQKKLEKRGVSLSTNQFEFSLTNRKNLKNGLIEACKDLGIIPIAHTPLDNGLATGIYTANNPSGGKVGGARYEFKLLDKLMPLHEAQAKVAKKVQSRLERDFDNQREQMLRKYQSKEDEEFNKEITTLQVAINYVIAKGAVPIPGIKNNKQAKEVLGCVGWGLTEEEVAILDEAAENSGR